MTSEMRDVRRLLDVQAEEIARQRQEIDALKIAVGLKATRTEEVRLAQCENPDRSAVPRFVDTHGLLNKIFSESNPRAFR